MGNFSYNRNLAIEKAEKLAKYLFFFDADDMIKWEFNNTR